MSNRGWSLIPAVDHWSAISLILSSPERVILFICFLKQQCYSLTLVGRRLETLRNKEGLFLSEGQRMRLEDCK